MKLKFFIVTVLFVILFTGCKKNEEYSNYSLITGDEWSLVSIQKDGQDVDQECEMGKLTFLDKEFKFTYAESSCCDEIEVVKAEWEFFQDGNSIKLEYSLKEDEMQRSDLIRRWNIIEISENVLVLEEEDESLTLTYER